MKSIFIFLLSVLVLLACTPNPNRQATQAISFTIHTENQQQTLTGFGSSLINFGRYWKEYPALYRTPEFQDFYVNTMGMNMLRCNLWGGVLMNPVENWEDIRFQDFDLTVSQVKKPGNRRDMQVFIDFAQAMIARNPEAKIIGTVWTPPPWMKMNNELTGTGPGAISGDRYINQKTKEPVLNRLKSEFYTHYAKYLVEWVKLFEHHTGKPLYGISIGNEVMFTQAFGSCVWTADDYGKMVVELGQMLEKEGYGDVIVYGPETMTSHNHAIANPMYVEVLTQGEASQYLDVFATHGYVDGFEEEYGAEGLLEFRKMIEATGKPLWITEGGTGAHKWPAPLTGMAAALHNALVYGHVEAITPWQITDPHPNTHGMMVYDQPTPKTYAAQHYFHFLEEGAVRVEVSPQDSVVNLSAFVHPENKTLTVVMINDSGDDQAISLQFTGPQRNTSDWKLYRTSATEHLNPMDDFHWEGGKLELEIPGLSMVTAVANF